MGALRGGESADVHPDLLILRPVAWLTPDGRNRRFFCTDHSRFVWASSAMVRVDIYGLEISLWEFNADQQLNPQKNEHFVAENGLQRAVFARRCFCATEGKNRIKLAAFGPVIYCQVACTRSM